MPNWIDTEGRGFGLVFWRFFLPEGAVETPSARREVRGAPWLSSSAERSPTRRARRPASTTSASDTGRKVSTGSLDSLEHRGRAQRARRVTIVEGELVGYLATGLRIVDERTAHPEIADARCHAADRDRRPGPHRHDDPPRPARAGPGRPRPAHVGGRPPVPAAGDRDLRHRPAHRRVRGHARRCVDLVIPGFRAMHPMGARLAAGVRADHRAATSAA